MSQPLQIAKASTTIPQLYRIPLLYLEPFFALSGVLLMFINPNYYIQTFSHATAAPLDPKTNFIYTQLAGAWLHFAFTEAVVLRLVDDVRVWRLLCMGMLLSDIAYCHSTAQAVGGWAVWLKVWEWNSDDWVATITTWPFVLARIAIVLAIGFRTEGEQVMRKDR